MEYRTRCYRRLAVTGLAGLSLMACSQAATTGTAGHPLPWDSPGAPHTMVHRLASPATPSPFPTAHAPSSTAAPGGATAGGSQGGGSQNGGGPGGGNGGGSQPTPQPNPTGSAGHVLVVMEENKGYSATVGDCSADPYLCSLASQYASSSEWYGVSHPSQPNYTAVVSGSTQGCTADDCVGAYAYSVPDLGGQLNAAGIPWRAYMEGMPSPCFTGAGSGLYALKHNPFIYFRDDASPCNDLPYPGAGGLLATLDSPDAPDFVWITPDLNDDMHDGSVQQGDAWLRANLPAVLQSSWFRDYPSTVIVTMDEGDGQPNGPLAGQQGGHIPLVIVSSNAAHRGTLAISGDHYGLLRSIEEVYGLPLLGQAGDASNGDVRALFG